MKNEMHLIIPLFRILHFTSSQSLQWFTFHKAHLQLYDK